MKKNEYKKIALVVLLVVAIVLIVIQNINPMSNIKNDKQINNFNGISKQVIVNVENNKNMEEKISKKGDVLTMNYTGRLENGTVFDSNVDPRFGHVEPFKFILGAGQVIAGWDEGLVGMKIGEKKTLVIPPEKAYGQRAIGDIIPANSTLVFDVELVGIE